VGGYLRATPIVKVRVTTVPAPSGHLEREGPAAGHLDGRGV